MHASRPAPPHLHTTPAELRLASERWRAAGMLVGLVPTMGALHAGHRALMRRARVDCDRVVVSIFVNPAQFLPGEDLGRYPRSLDADLAACAEEGVDAVYLPSATAMYPVGFATGVALSGPLVESLEGAVRPGHFAGVALVVTKLLAATRADRAYFGCKDAQQSAVVRRLAADLDLGTGIVVVPTVRDADGLALSSRNVYLSAGQRQQALAIPRGLAAAAALVQQGARDAHTVLAAVAAELALSRELEVDYVALVDGATFEPVVRVDQESRIQVAARIAGTRLIDTLSLMTERPPAVSPRLRAASTAVPAG